MISSNGAVVRGFDGHLLDRRFLPVETARRLSLQFRGYGTLVFTLTGKEWEPWSLKASSNCTPALTAGWTQISPLVRSAAHRARFDRGEEPIQGMICGTVEEMVAETMLMSDVAGQIAMHRTEYAARNLSILDLLPPGCSKARRSIAWPGFAAWNGRRSWPSVTTSTTWKCSSTPGTPWYGQCQRRDSCPGPAPGLGSLPRMMTTGWPGPSKRY